MAWIEHWVHASSAGWSLDDDGPASVTYGTQNSDTHLFINLYNRGYGVFGEHEFPRIRFGLQWPLAGHSGDDVPGVIASVLVRMASIPARRSDGQGGVTVAKPPGVTTLDIYEHNERRWTRWNRWDLLSPLPSNRYGTLEIALDSARWFVPGGPLSVVVGFGGAGAVHVASVGLRIGFPDLFHTGILESLPPGLLTSPVPPGGNQDDLIRADEERELPLPEDDQRRFDEMPIEDFEDLANRVVERPPDALE